MSLDAKKVNMIFVYIYIDPPIFYIFVQVNNVKPYFSIEPELE